MEILKSNNNPQNRSFYNSTQNTKTKKLTEVLNNINNNKHYVQQRFGAIGVQGKLIGWFCA